MAIGFPRKKKSLLALPGSTLFMWCCTMPKASLSGQAVFNTGFAVHLTAPNIYRGSAFQWFSTDNRLKWPRHCGAAIENIAFPFTGQSNSRLSAITSTVQLWVVSGKGQHRSSRYSGGNSSTSILSNVMYIQGAGAVSNQAL